MTPFCVAQQGKTNDSPQKLLPVQWLPRSPGDSCQPRTPSGPAACHGHWTCGDTQSELLPGSVGRHAVFISWPGPDPTCLSLFSSGPPSSRGSPMDPAKAHRSQNFYTLWHFRTTKWLGLVAESMALRGRQTDQLDFKKLWCGFPVISQLC